MSIRPRPALKVVMALNPHEPITFVPFQQNHFRTCGYLYMRQDATLNKFISWAESFQFVFVLKLVLVAPTKQIVAFLIIMTSSAKGGFLFCTEYPSYALLYERSSKIYFNGEILNNSKPGAYAYVAKTNEQRHNAFFDEVRHGGGFD